MPEGLDLREALAERVVLLDGGLGTQLIAEGLRPGEAPEALTLLSSDLLVGIHRRYLEAGAEVIQTNTFGANRLKLPGELEVAEVNERAVAAARLAIEESGLPGRLVAGELGPSGRFFPPVGDLDAEEARDAFREQATVLDRAGVDAFIVETMVDLREAVEAARAVREVSGKPLLVSLTFDAKPRGYFTLMGDAPAAAAEALLFEGADAVGANCTLTPGAMLGLAREMRQATDAPLVFQPNAGKAGAAAEGATAPNEYDTVLVSYADGIMRIVGAGANAVGGCCGTDPGHIRAVKDRLDGGRG
ncbi:MAG: homocysteine S-methyltransferase family protein [Planctomycetota bacterium]|jgi:methionine synthase I (cobalamin-dependent)